MVLKFKLMIQLFLVKLLLNVRTYTFGKTFGSDSVGNVTKKYISLWSYFCLVSVLHSKALVFLQPQQHEIQVFVQSCRCYTGDVNSVNFGKRFRSFCGYVFLEQNYKTSIEQQFQLEVRKLP